MRYIVGLLLLLTLSCQPPDQSGDVKSEDVLKELDATDDVAWVRPEGAAVIRFRVSDVANKTYKDGQMKWTGSFRWNAEDNTIVHATSWLPTDGPYPVLYDDGPISKGGHEPEDAVAGDHIFQCEVYFFADAENDAEREFEYGVLNEWDRWIWIGPNGTFSVPKGFKDVMEVPGLTIPAFGDKDFLVTLDISKLHPEFATITPYNPGTGDGYRVYLKSSANSWTPVELLDDGKRGDAVAGDGIFTYVQSSRIQAGGHDGLVSDGQHVQFVFVFALDGIAPDDGSEYKVTDEIGNHCAVEGVEVMAGPTDSMKKQMLILERDSKGKVFNTAFVVGGGFASCRNDSDCVDPTGSLNLACNTEAQTCYEQGNIEPSHPTIKSVSPGSGPVAGGTDVTITGSDFRIGVSVSFGDAKATKVQRLSGSELVATTPPHPKGKVDVIVTNPDKGEAIAKDAFEFIEGQVSNPMILLINPSKGPVSGGTEVILTGKQFQDTPIVKFGGAFATKVMFISSEEVHAWTPPHEKGVVTVTLINPDSGSASFPNGFEFVEELVPPMPDWAQLDEPLTVIVNASEETEALFAEVYEAGLTDGGLEPPGMLAQVGFGPAGSDPSSASGWVWSPAFYSHGGGTYGNNAIYTGTLMVTVAGEYAFTFRFSLDGGTTWLYADSDGSGGGSQFSVEKLGKLVVLAVDPEAPKITKVTPAYGPTKGGTAVTITGSGFMGVTEVEIGELSVPATASLDGTTVSFTTPVHAMGQVAITLTNGAKKQTTKPKAFTFVPYGTPVMDGKIEEDWHPTFLVATTSIEPDWGAGKNELKALYVAFDDTYLYVAVSGTVESNNAIVGYLDRDFGAGTGYSDMKALSDVTGALDNAISSKLVVNVAGFGADYAFGTKGMASVTESSTWPETDNAGWRDFTYPGPGDFGWKAGVVKCGDGAVEAAIRLETLFSSALPQNGSMIGLVVRILNSDGLYASAQALPQATSAQDLWVMDKVALVPFHL